MKAILAALCAFFLFLNNTPGYSQAIVFDKSELALTIEQVLNDYPNHFKNLLGEPLIQNPQTAEYGSTVCPKGASQCIVIKYSSDKKEIYSWEASFEPTDDFNEANQKFREFYNQMRGLTFNNGDKKYILSASYKEPDESLKFHSIIFSSSSGNKQVKNLKAELLLEAGQLEWKIRILVYEKERADDERGESRES